MQEGMINYDTVEQDSFHRKRSPTLRQHVVVREALMLHLQTPSFSISTNEKRTIQASRNVLDTLATSASPNCTNYMAEAIAVSGNVPAAADS